MIGFHRASQDNKIALDTANNDDTDCKRVGSSIKDNKNGDDTKGGVTEEEEYSDEKLKSQPKIDYSGAHEKTDPREIALVKKLDRWIMVCTTLC